MQMEILQRKSFEISWKNQFRLAWTKIIMESADLVQNHFDRNQPLFFVHENTTANVSLCVCVSYPPHPPTPTIQHITHP